MQRLEWAAYSDFAVANGHNEARRQRQLSVRAGAAKYVRPTTFFSSTAAHVRMSNGRRFYYHPNC